MGVETPKLAVVAVLSVHAKWQKQQEKRHTSEYLIYKLVNLEIAITNITTYLEGVS